MALAKTGCGFPPLTSDEEPEEPTGREMLRGGTKNVLLVDDEEFIRDLGSRILTGAGYTIITASNGKEGLEVYQTRGDEIALVILDLVMPEMGGTQCLEALLRLNPSTKVVIASGYTANGPTEDALAIGAKGFVAKPFGFKELSLCLHDVLNGTGN